MDANGKRLAASVRKRWASWARAWWTPSFLGVKLTFNGIGCLMLVLLVKHLLVAPPPRWSLPLAIALWIVWIAGAILIIVGVGRTVIVDVPERR